MRLFCVVINDVDTYTEASRIIDHNLTTIPAQFFLKMSIT
jgi:hypothetical protein